MTLNIRINSPFGWKSTHVQINKTHSEKLHSSFCWLLQYSKRIWWYTQVWSFEIISRHMLLLSATDQGGNGSITIVWEWVNLRINFYTRIQICVMWVSRKSKFIETILIDKFKNRSTCECIEEWFNHKWDTKIIYEENPFLLCFVMLRYATKLVKFVLLMQYAMYKIGTI